MGGALSEDVKTWQIQVKRGDDRLEVSWMGLAG